ncbi:hypothetical protein OF83DRAFT_274908 [Amylostereum chailletii]|nr:hypothetical protein OF83DRAFT_274908 [Amylostereum chailletii]
MERPQRRPPPIVHPPPQQHSSLRFGLAALVLPQTLASMETHARTLFSSSLFGVVCTSGPDGSTPHVARAPEPAARAQVSDRNTPIPHLRSRARKKHAQIVSLEAQARRLLEVGVKFALNRWTPRSTGLTTINSCTGRPNGLVIFSTVDNDRGLGRAPPACKPCFSPPDPAHDISLNTLERTSWDSARAHHHRHATFGFHGCESSKEVSGASRKTRQYTDRIMPQQADRGTSSHDCTSIAPIHSSAGPRSRSRSIHPSLYGADMVSLRSEVSRVPCSHSTHIQLTSVLAPLFRDNGWRHPRTSTNGLR